MDAKNLRSSIYECPFFGKAKLMDENTLPTKADVIRHFLYIKHVDKIRFRKKIVDPMILFLKNVWDKASIPSLSMQHIDNLIKKMLDFYDNLVYDHNRNRQLTISHKENVDKFINDCQNLFDIATCKCYVNKCVCSIERKVFPLELSFLQDQRTERKMVIGPVDTKMTQEINSKIQRKQKLQTYYSKIADDDSHNTVSNTVDLELPSSTETQSSSIVKPINDQMRKHLPTVARECDRYGASDRMAAAIVSATLQDFGIITDTSSTNIVDRNKIRRARSGNRKQLQNSSILSLESLYFDGKKDLTKFIENKGGKNYYTTKQEEHYVMIQEPCSEYIGHVSPSSGTSADIFQSMISFFAEKNIPLDNLSVVGCDGTNINTGIHRGVIRLIELHIKRPVQWFICLLHANELPLRHFFNYIDGGTTGPSSFSGSIGKALEKCENLEIVKFNSIPFSDLPVDMAQDLSTDQEILLKLCKGISIGIISKDLAARLLIRYVK